MRKSYVYYYIMNNIKISRIGLLVLLLLSMSFVSNVHSQNILGKWVLIELEDKSIDWKLDWIDKELRITLSFFSDGTFKKTMFQYSPFDNFREELPEVNTLDDDVKKTKNRKVKYIGDYSLENRSRLTLKTNGIIYVYDVKLDGDTLLIVNRLFDPLGESVIYQKFLKK